MYLPAACEEALIQLQLWQRDGGGSRGVVGDIGGRRSGGGDGLMLSGSDVAVTTPPLALYLSRGVEPGMPRVGAYSHPRRSSVVSAGSWLLRSGSDGGGSLRLSQPQAGWYYLLVHAAAVATPRAEYDLRVVVQSGARAAALATGTLPRLARLAPVFRYRVDPEGYTDLPEIAIAHHLSPM
jgi:hypothetical protein